MFRALFKPQTKDIEAIHKFLLEKLQEPRKFILGHAGRIMVELYAEDFDLSNDQLRDECWKTAEWIRHKNPVGNNLKYSVMGYEGTKIIYSSGCQICRDKNNQRPHYEHEGEG